MDCEDRYAGFHVLKAYPCIMMCSGEGLQCCLCTVWAAERRPGATNALPRREHSTDHARYLPVHWWDTQCKAGGPSSDLIRLLKPTAGSARSLLKSPQTLTEPFWAGHFHLGSGIALHMALASTKTRSWPCFLVRPAWFAEPCQAAIEMSLLNLGSPLAEDNTREKAAGAFGPMC